MIILILLISILCKNTTHGVFGSGQSYHRLFQGGPKVAASPGKGPLSKGLAEPRPGMAGSNAWLTWLGKEFHHRFVTYVFTSRVPLWILWN